MCIRDRDILLRGRIRNEAAFARVASFVLDNVGNQTSASAIEKALRAGGHRVSAETIDNYLSLMQKAHLIYRCAVSYTHLRLPLAPAQAGRRGPWYMIYPVIVMRIDKGLSLIHI